MSFFVQWIYLLGLALWVGGIVFFSFFTTPTVFIQLPKEMASNLISALFPKYYLLGYFCGGAMALATLIESALMRQLPWIRLLVLALMIGCSVYAGQAIRPQVHDVKVQMKSVEEGTDIAKTLKTRFDSLHRLSVVLNVVVLAGGLFLISIVAYRLRI